MSEKTRFGRARHKGITNQSKVNKTNIEYFDSEGELGTDLLCEIKSEK